MRAIDNMSSAEIDELRLKGMLNSSGPIKTIWNSDGSDGETLLICAPTHEDIQRMAGFPEDAEGYAEAAEADRQNEIEEDEEIKASRWVGAEDVPYSHEEAEARREFWGCD